MKMEEISLYFHIPFCIKKCGYCAFNSFHLKKFNEKQIFDYFYAVLKELDNYHPLLSKKEISTIYFGGGTPSAINSDFLLKIMEKLKKYFFSENIEITVEINPATVSENKLEKYLEMGINRVSIGVQSFSNDILNFLGRSHNSLQAFETVKSVKKYFKNFSVDLIFAIPGQTNEQIFKDLKILTELNVPHLSFYALSVEENTDFYQKGIKEADDEIFAETYMKICEVLCKKGYNHYEISNFSLPGFESMHNINYWAHNEYIGIGAGAHSFIKNIRKENFKDVFKYIASVKKFGKAFCNEEKLSEKQLANEFLFLSLRQAKGLDIYEYENRFQNDFIKKFKEKISLYEKAGLIKQIKNRIILTEKGFTLSNEICSNFFI